MIEQGQILANHTQSFEVIGFEPSGHALGFELTKVGYLNLHEHSKREIPFGVLERFLQNEMKDFQILPKP